MLTGLSCGDTKTSIRRLHLILPLDDGGDDKFVKPIAQDPTKHGTDAVRDRACLT